MSESPYVLEINVSGSPATLALKEFADRGDAYAAGRALLQAVLDAIPRHYDDVIIRETSEMAGLDNGIDGYGMRMREPYASQMQRTLDRHLGLRLEALDVLRDGLSGALNSGRISADIRRLGNPPRGLPDILYTSPYESIRTVVLAMASFEVPRDTKFLGDALEGLSRELFASPSSVTGFSGIQVDYDIYS